MTSAAQARYVLDPTGQDVYGEIEALRSDGPVVQAELPGGLLAWVVVGYDEIIKVLKSRTFSKDALTHWGDLKAGRVQHDWPLMMWVARAGMFTADGPRHRDLRSWAAPAFSARRIDRLRPMIEQIVSSTLDSLETRRSAGRHGEAVDLRAEFCFPVPIEAIGALLGVPDDLTPTFRAGADALFDTAISPAEAQTRFMALLSAIDELVARKQTTPGRDLTSDLLKAMHSGDRYTTEDLLETVRLMIVAGYETTGNLIDQAIFALLTHPQHLAAVRAGEVSWDDVIDETLRWAGPAANLPLRFSTKDYEIADVTIRRGDAVLISYVGAGRDPRKHAAPAVFDPTRPKKDHLGFGHGAHYCLGAPLAVLEAKAALPALFDRYPDMRLAEEPSTIPANPGFITNGHARLPIYLGTPRP